MSRRRAMAAIATALALGLAGCHPRANLEHGRRLADIAGCISCHGPRLDGHLVEDDPEFALAWSSNLSRLLPRWSDAQLDAVLRTGRRPDGSALWIMPTFAHRELTGTEMRDLIAWLRSVTPTGEDHPRIKPGPRWAAALRAGMSDSASQAERLAARAPPDLGPETAQGRHLARLACAECHGPELKGAGQAAPGAPPDLAAAAAYDAVAFRRLVHAGLGRDGKPLGGMAEPFARERLGALTAGEIDAIRAYLLALAAAS